MLREPQSPACASGGGCPLRVLYGMIETMVGTKYSPTNPWSMATAKEHTPSWGLLFLEHARELQQTVWSLHNRLFCIGCFKKSKGFFLCM